MDPTQPLQNDANRGSSFATFEPTVIQPTVLSTDGLLKTEAADVPSTQAQQAATLLSDSLLSNSDSLSAAGASTELNGPTLATPILLSEPPVIDASHSPNSTADPITFNQPDQEASKQSNGISPLPIVVAPQPNPVLVSGSSNSSDPEVAHMKKRVIKFGAIFVVVMIAVAGFVFGYYLPNRPSNIYKTGVNRSAKALNLLINQAIDQSKLTKIDKTELNMTIDASVAGGNFGGTLDAKFDSSAFEGALSLNSKAKDLPEQNLKTNFQANIPAGSLYPNLFFQMTGLKSFGVEQLAPQLLPYDGKWISITADYLKTLTNAPTAKDITSKQPSATEIAELARVFNGSVTDYVFSTKPDKAVFEMKKFVAKENVDGVSAYHYQVGINDANAVKFCKDLTEKVFATSGYKKLPWVDDKNIDKDKQAALKECDTTTTNVKPNMVYDLWVDAKYKLIYKIRIPDETDNQKYVEFGQLYRGGDSVSLFINFHDPKAKRDAKLSIEVNLKTASTSGLFSLTSDDKDLPMNIKITMTTKPYSGEIKTTNPVGAIPIQDLLKTLGIDPKTSL